MAIYEVWDRRKTGGVGRKPRWTRGGVDERTRIALSSLRALSMKSKYVKKREKR